MRRSLIFENRIGKVRNMARDMKDGIKPKKKVKYLRLGYVQREPLARQKKTEKKDPKKIQAHECAGGLQNCKSCRTNSSVISPASEPKDANETETGGGYCGGDSSCKGKKSCMECEERPKFVAIDYPH